MNEFSLINDFFKSIPLKRSSVVYGIGDDAACMEVPEGSQLLVSTDTLVSGVHFLPEWDPQVIASKAVRVNISDMAAMAAEPCWITLALTIPEINIPWLQSFTQGIKNTLNTFNIDLVGGDTTRGPLSITITIMGLAPQGQSVRRCGAKPGDVILVSGELGGAALAVKLLHESNISADDKTELMNKLHYPNPRVDLLTLLQKFASSAIDISDGLSADLNHICKASGVGATLNADAIPVHPLVPKYWQKNPLDLALTGGDDYELCFTIPPERFNVFMQEIKNTNLTCFPIGLIDATCGLRMRMNDDQIVSLFPQGYSHF